MSLRNFIYRLLLPPGLALWLIYVGILFTVERGDIYSSAKLRIEDQTQVIAAFLEAQEFDSRDEWLRYFEEIGELKGDFLKREIPDFEFAIYSKATTDILFQWPNELAAENPMPANLENGKIYYSGGTGWINYPERAFTFVPLTSLVDGDSMVLSVSANNPKDVYWEHTLWIEIGLVLLILLLLSCIVAEWLCRHMMIQMEQLRQYSEAVLSRSARSKLNARVLIRELVDLESTMETLQQTFAGIREKGVRMADESRMVIEEGRMTALLEEQTRAVTRFEASGFTCEIFACKQQSVHEFGFIFPGSECICAVFATIDPTLDALDATLLKSLLQSEIQKRFEGEGLALKIDLTDPTMSRIGLLRIWLVDLKSDSITSQTLNGNETEPVVVGPMPLTTGLSILTQNLELPEDLKSRISQTKVTSIPIFKRNLFALYEDFPEAAILIIENLKETPLPLR